MTLSESNKFPGTHIFYIFDFLCRSSEVRSVTWPPRLYEGNTEIAHAAIEMIKYELRRIKYCCYTLLSFLPAYFCIFYAVWRHRWSTWILLDHRVFVNNFRSNWDRETRKEPLWWRWAAKSSDNRLGPLAQSMTWRSLHNLTLTSGSTLTLTFTKQNVFHSTRLDERISMVSGCRLCGHFCRSYEHKTKTRLLGHWPDLWGHRLTWDLKFGYQSVRLVMSDTLVLFREASAQLRAKQRRGVVPPPLGRYEENR